MLYCIVSSPRCFPSIIILTSVDHVTITLTLPRGVGLGLGLGTLPVLLSGEQVLHVDMLFDLRSLS